MAINWEVVLWTCVTLAALLALIGLVLTIISAVNMSKRRKQLSEIHTTLGVGSKVMFAGGILGKVVRMSEDEFIGVEIAPKTIIEVSRFAVQAIENK
jgi:preprotein translocase subunit YajC